MPETFGSGTAGPAWTPRAQPWKLGYSTLAPGGGSNVTAGFPQQILVITAVDIVSNGGGSGGALFAWTESDGQWFCVFNLGSNADAFSWRGWLVLNNRTFGYVNSSDTTVEIHTSGLAFPSL